MTIASPIVLTPDAGPTDPPSSAANAGLLPGIVWRYDLAGAGEQIIEAGFIVEPRTSYRIAVYPALGTDHSAWGSTRISAAFMSDGHEFVAHDQYGHRFTPDADGWLITDQWNLVDLDISALNGRRIDQVVIRSGEGASGHGWLQLLGETPLAPRLVEPIDRVRTTRGSHSGAGFSRGNTYPAVGRPQGAHFVTPVTNARTDRWIYRWHPAEGRTLPALQALAFAHAPSPWIGDRNAFQVMPWVDQAQIDPIRRQMDFSHDDELDRPHHYRVDLAGGVRAEATATARCGFFRFTYPTAPESTRRRRDRPRRGVILDQPTDGTLRTRTLPGGRVAFEAYLPARSASEVAAYVYGETVQPASVHPIRAPRTPGTGIVGALAALRVGAALRQATSLQLTDGDVLEVKAAMSFISINQARHTLSLEVGCHDFDEVLTQSHDEWASLLGRLEIDGATPDQLTCAYSNLARLYLWPNAHHENDGDAETPHWVYASPWNAGVHTPTHTGCEVREGTLFVNNGYWDTYRTAWPAYHLLTPERAGGLLDGILTAYRDSGFMSRWSAPGHIDYMVATSSDTIFADAAAHRIDFDELTAYDSALTNAQLPAAHPATGRKQIGRARFIGWVGCDEPEGFSWSIENAICDAAIGLWSARLAPRAASLGVPERHDEFVANARYFLNRSLLVRELFDPEVGFFQGRRSDGSRHVDPRDFDPTKWGGDYTETNAWGMAFSTVHDGRGLAAAYGGPNGLAAKLDKALATPASLNPGAYPKIIHEMVEARALRMGQLAMSNQPAHHIPYMFLHAGQPWRTQWLTREILDRAFVGSDIGQGYPGDEDNGEMSAWWLLSALGLYPLQPGSGEFVLTAPLFSRAAWRIDDHATLTVIAHGASQGNRYIHSVTVNGQPWDQVTIPVEVLKGGPTIEIWLRDVASRWGHDSRPASATVPVLRDLSSMAHANLTDRKRRDHVANALIDDVGETLMHADEGSVLTLRWGHDIAPTFFTLTTDQADAPEVTVEYLLGPDWHEIGVTANAPRFANQPVPTLLPAGLHVRGLRWRFASPCSLRQVEVF